MQSTLHWMDFLPPPPKKKKEKRKEETNVQLLQRVESVKDARGEGRQRIIRQRPVPYTFLSRALSLSLSLSLSPASAAVLFICTMQMHSLFSPSYSRRSLGLDLKTPSAIAVMPFEAMVLKRRSGMLCSFVH